MMTMEALGVMGKINMVGLSYGGFVAYSMAAKFPEAFERVVILGAGVCLDSEIDLEEGLFSAKNIKDAANVLLAQTPEGIRELLTITFFNPPNVNCAPNCVLNDFIEVSLFR